jgi:hypothetical protein
MNRNERLITRKVIELAEKAGWYLAGVDDGGDMNVGPAYMSSADFACHQGLNLDEMTLFFKHYEKKQTGSVVLIFSNGDEGFTVVSDYHTNLTFMDAKPDGTVGQYHEAELTIFTARMQAYYYGTKGYEKVKGEAYLRRDKLEYHALDMADALVQADYMCTHALAEFNWGASVLTAAGIKMLNEVPAKIRSVLGMLK